jgi:hypothetical protein
VQVASERQQSRSVSHSPWNSKLPAEGFLSLPFEIGIAVSGIGACQCNAKRGSDLVERSLMKGTSWCSVFEMLIFKCCYPYLHNCIRTPINLEIM